MEEQNKKKNKAGKIILNAAFFSVMAFLVMIFVWNFVDIQSGYKYPIFGTRTSVITTQSMATVNAANTYITPEMKQIQKNDVITTVAYKSYDDIKIYDIATYYGGSRTLVCHRVVDKYVAQDGKQYVVFRGDANNVNDAPVLYSLVRGKVTNVTPKMGSFISFIQSPYLFIALFGSIFFVALAIFIIDSKKGNKQKEEKPQEVVADQPQEEQVEEVKPEEKPQEEPQEQKEEKPYQPSTPLVELEPVKESDEANQEAQPELVSLDAPIEEPINEEKEEAPALEKLEPQPQEAEETQSITKIKEPESGAEEENPEPKKEVTFRTYHVSKRKEDGKWTVKYAGGEKVIKLFDTQKEALEYTNKMAENQGGSVLVHASKGANKGRIKKK